MEPGMPGSDPAPGKALGEGEEEPQIPKAPWEQGMAFPGIPIPGNEWPRRDNGATSASGKKIPVFF